MKLYESFGEFLPYRGTLEDLLRYSGIEAPVLKFSGFIMLYSIALGLLSFIFSLLIFPILISVGIGIGVFMGFQGLIYLLLVLISGKRADEVEKVLPDALLLISANIRAGMGMDRAIWLSARPEFGPLEEEIKRVGSKVLGGETMDNALKEMKNRIKSPLLDRAIKLTREGIRSGGEMAHLLEETAKDIRNSQEMKKEVKSNVMMYSLFIIFASVLGAPLLFSISLYFIETTNQLWGAQMQGAQKGFEKMGGFIEMQGPQVSPTTLFWFSLACILLTTFFGSLIIGLIQSGEEKKGIKYIPLMTGGGLAVFFIAKFLISGLFGSFIGF